jgi:hypothetical protein
MGRPANGFIEEQEEQGTEKIFDISDIHRDISAGGKPSS